MSMNLWAVRMERALTAQEMEQLLRILPMERRERLLRHRNRSRWREPLCAYGLLRLALLRTYGFQKIPELTLGERGKPVFFNYPTTYFNISHTDGAVLVGLSNAPMGVDIEKVRPVSQRVHARLAAEGVSQEEYFRRWVRYEAAVKRGGEGVSPHYQPDGTEDAWEVSIYPKYCAAVSGTGPVEAIYRCAIEDLTADLEKY